MEQVRCGALQATEYVGQLYIEQENCGRLLVSSIVAVQHTDSVEHGHLVIMAVAARQHMVPEVYYQWVSSNEVTQLWDCLRMAVDHASDLGLAAEVRQAEV